MNKPLRIAIASGKGGTGKTTIATNLAVTLAETEGRTAYVDCDVEEPNGHIFLKPTIRTTREVSILVPEVDTTRCTFCGACGTACRYSAVLVLPKTVLTFPKLCHGCGGCTRACTERAIREVPRVTGIVEEGMAGQVAVVHGKLIVGEAMAPPVIRAALTAVPSNHTVVIDAPPGTSCPAIESVKTADVVLLVTEPTPFGLNDLRLAVEMVRDLGVPFGVAVNRMGIGDGAVLEYCANEQIPVLLEVPNDRAIACAYSRGELAITALPDLRTQLLALYEKLNALALPRVSRRTGRRHLPRVEESESGRPSSEVLQLDKKNGLRDLVVISGKGGTGKTSLVASFFALARQAAVADCDVDAADLYLVLDPAVQQRRLFAGGKTAVIDAELCNGCGVCIECCRFDAICVPTDETNVAYEIDPVSCEGCGVCVDVCPEGAATLHSFMNGEWFVSETRHGPMVHARLGTAQENSGKLVSLVRGEATTVAQSSGREFLICDGSPGIGCPVIASITGAHAVLVVTEPTLSGLHDLQRIATLCQQFNITAGVCINKADLNPEIATEIEADAARQSLPILGRIRYDESVTAAQLKRLAVVEDGESPAAADIRALWEQVKNTLKGA